MSEVKEAKKLAEMTKKKEASERDLKNETKMLEKRINEGSDTSMKAIDVKYAAKRDAHIQKEIDRLT